MEWAFPEGKYQPDRRRGSVVSGRANTIPLVFPDAVLCFAWPAEPVAVILFLHTVLETISDSLGRNNTWP